MAKVKDLKEKQMVDILVVLDESGSMESLTKDVIGSFNSFLSQQKKDGDDAFITLVKFASESEVIYERIGISDAKPLSSETYCPGGATALNDAIDRGIRIVESKNKNNKVIVAIITDGEENNSRETTLEQVKEKIKNKESAGWKFVFLAANIDAFSAGGKIGIFGRGVSGFSATGQGVCKAFCATSLNVSGYRSSVRAGTDSSYVVDANAKDKK